MGEHDNLVSNALNNMTLNELAHTYADLKSENQRLRNALEHITGRKRLDRYNCTLETVQDYARKALGSGKSDG